MKKIIFILAILLVISLSIKDGFKKIDVPEHIKELQQTTNYKVIIFKR